MGGEGKIELLESSVNAEGILGQADSLMASRSHGEGGREGGRVDKWNRICMYKKANGLACR